jgi:hypothetical protein
MKNPLVDILSPAWRKRLYLLYFLACAVVGSLITAHVHTGSASDVLLYVGGVLGLTAASNTPKAAPVDLSGSAKPTS